ncbi:NADP-dependent oxidoreductase [Microbacterium sp. X-17]|uniref:NADP-dependent oxidoreductase n=1 Tax=Microbacterium sp. X-17 TaxID=3144404 RepID=UPI0031F58C0E
MTEKRWIAPSFGDADVLELERFEVGDLAPTEVEIEVRAVGMNPADAKAVAGAYARNASALPIRPGYEVSGVVRRLGADAAGSGLAVGDEVLAFRISDGYATAVVTDVANVFPKPAGLSFAVAANLLLAATTAADTLRVVDVEEGDVVLVHGASGSVGGFAIQLARREGAEVIGTTSARHRDEVDARGAIAVEYGDGLRERIAAVTHRVDAAIDCVGTDEAVDVSEELVADRSRIVTIAAQARAKADGFPAVGGGTPESAAFRDSVRQQILDLAGSGELRMPPVRTFPFADARDALRLLASGHPGGKLALEVTAADRA